MTEQHALWTEPSLTDRWPVGTDVRSTWTENAGTVVAHDDGRLVIRWQKWRNEADGFECFHSSDSGLVRA